MHFAPRVTATTVSSPALRARALAAVCLAFLTFAGLGLPGDRALAEGLPSLGSAKTSQLEQQRQFYLAARNALQLKQYTVYQQYRDRLHGYPLSPYLDYYYLNRRLSRLPSEQVSQFLDSNSDSHLGDKLRQRWLLTLAKKNRWQEYLRFYSADLRSTTLSCFALQARHASGDELALQEVEPLWNVEHSQPNDCDPLFDTWIAAGGLTPDIAWQRFNKAMSAGNRTLGNYLLRYLTGEELKLAELQIEIGRYPHRIARSERFQQQSPAIQNIILYGIKHYARQDPLAALQAWYRYDAQQLFNSEQRHETQQQLALYLLRKGHHDEVTQLIADIPEISSKTLTEIIIVDALKQQDWPKVHQHIVKLDLDAQREERWLYWRARALEQAELSDPVYNSAGEIYTLLAIRRDYYSFLAADKLGRDYHLGDTPANINPEKLLTIQTNPAARRARELLAIGDTTNASREWYYMSRRLNSEDEHIAAASLAHQWGWHNQTIISLASARSWDDLQMRFPLAYDKQVLAAAQKHSISPLLLFAIARQESAFAEQARSPAGALGLMQLMPGTARQTASRAGVKYQQPHELLLPEKNITLGSYYVNELLEKYEGNRILAAAAYNAGPHRVDQWLQRSAKQLPIDIWIESIPFRETRKYVQNVLAYSVIYGYRTGSIPDMLTRSEAGQRL